MTCKEKMKQYVDELISKYIPNEHDVFNCRGIARQSVCSKVCNKYGRLGANRLYPIWLYDYVTTQLKKHYMGI